MKIALFAHLPGRRALPRRRPRHRAAAGAAGPRGRVPRAQTCCGQMHVNTGYQRRGAAAGAPPRRGVRAATTRSSRRPGRAWGRSATSTRWSPGGRATRRSPSGPRRWRPRPTSCPSCWSTSSGSTDVGAYYPHRVTYHPTCHSLRMLRVGDKPLRLLRARPRADADRAARRRPVLRVRRHVRGQERRHVDGDARRQDGATCCPPTPRCCTAGDASCLMHIGGGLSRLRSGTRTVHLAEILADVDEPPDAPVHPRRRHDARDLGMPDRRAGRASGTCAATESFPDAARAALRRRPAAAQPRPRHRAPSATSAPPVVAELPDWAELRAAGRGDQGRHDGPPRRAPRAARGAGHRPRRRRALGRATPTRPTRSSPGWCRPPAPTRSSRSSRWPPRRSGSTRRSEAAGIAAHETDLAELIVQLGDDKPSHILVPAIHRNRAEIREIFLREMPGVDPELTDEPRRLAMAARAHLRERFLRARVGDLRRQLRRRRDRARCSSSSPRATAGCA